MAAEVSRQNLPCRGSVRSAEDASSCPVQGRARNAPERFCRPGAQRVRGTSLCFRHEELERVAREREAVLAAANSAHVEQLQALEARALELQAQCETLELQLRRTQWRQGDALKEKDAVIYK